MKEVGENARGAADLYWNSLFGSVHRRRTERNFLSGGRYLRANARRNSAAGTVAPGHEDMGAAQETWSYAGVFLGRRAASTQELVVESDGYRTAG